MKGIIDELRPKLVTFRDERGRELFDLPKAPRPDEDTPAPIRFLPEYDNLLLAHDDRSRVISDEHRKRIFMPNLRILSTFLVDGFVAGAWSIERKKKVATIKVEPFAPLKKKIRDDVAKEADLLVRFAEDDANEFRIAFV